MIQRSQFKTAIRSVRLGNAVTWYKNMRTQFFDMTSSQGEAVKFIMKNYRRREISAADLMEEFGLSQSTVAGIISRLEAKELIYRFPDPEDGRKIFLRPTEKGMELDERLKQVGVDTEAVLLAGFTEEEKEEFNRLLLKALNNMDAARAAGGQNR